MQHPASPAVARPSCQTLGMAGTVVNSVAPTGAVSMSCSSSHGRPLRLTHWPSEVPRKLNRHHCALASGSAQTAPPTVRAGHPSRFAGGRRSRVLHSRPRSVVTFALASVSIEPAITHAAQHPSHVLQGFGRASEAGSEFVFHHCPASMPNLSIEGTCNIRLRRLSPAPHVKR